MPGEIKPYLVVTDPLTDSEAERLENFLNNSVADWLKDIPQAYYIAYSGTHLELLDIFRDKLPSGRSFLVTLIDDQFAGMLSHDSWDFIKKHTNRVEHIQL